MAIYRTVQSISNKKVKNIDELGGAKISYSNVKFKENFYISHA